MNERLTIGIFILLGLCIGVAGVFAFMGDIPSAKDIVANVASGLIGALTGGSIVHSVSARNATVNEAPVTEE